MSSQFERRGDREPRERLDVGFYGCIAVLVAGVAVLVLVDETIGAGVLIVGVLAFVALALRRGVWDLPWP